MPGLVPGEQSPEPEQGASPRGTSTQGQEWDQSMSPQTGRSLQVAPSCGLISAPTQPGVSVGCPFTSGPQCPPPYCLPPGHQENPGEMGGKL